MCRVFGYFARRPIRSLAFYLTHVSVGPAGQHTERKRKKIIDFFCQNILFVIYLFIVKFSSGKLSQTNTESIQLAATAETPIFNWSASTCTTMRRLVASKSILILTSWSQYNQSVRINTVYWPSLESFFCWKIEILVENCNSGRKSKFWWKISDLFENRNFGLILKC